MSLEHGLIFGVALVIVLNRVFVGTGLVRFAPLYGFVQAFNLGACAVLCLTQIFPDRRLDLAARGFLMAFVAWHMVHNSAARAALRPPTRIEVHELEAAQQRMEEQIEAERLEGQAAAGGAPATLEREDAPSSNQAEPVTDPE